MQPDIEEKEEHDDELAPLQESVEDVTSFMKPDAETKQSKDKAKKPKPKRGDRLSFLAVYETADGETHDSFEGDHDLFLVSSILNLQRQYAACQNHADNASFGGELLGHRDTIMTEEVFHESALDEDACEDGSKSLDIDIPSLNKAQEHAAANFLMGERQSIHIVQG
ncbi:MAG: hypothetical protein SGARI_007405, partial [Bacillariaceae sp.]